MFIAVSEFLFRYKRNEHIIEVIQTFTLLHAIRCQYSDVVTSLLPDEQNINTTRSSTNLPIHIESRSLASQFLNRKFHHDKLPRDNYRMKTLFLWAASNRLTRVAMLLLEQKGLVIDESDIEHWMSAGAAARHGCVEAMNILIDEGKIDANGTDNGWSILQLAAQVGHLAVVERLLQAGADVNTEPSNSNGRTALWAAAKGGHHAVVDRLLQAGADVNAKPSYDDGRTALQAAAGGGHQAVVERLLQAGADVNAKPSYDDGRTALQAAAGGGHQAVVERLLQAGADVNAKPSNYSGRTALQAAAGGGHQAVVERLLQAGADVNAKPSNHRGRTALQAAAGGGHQAVVERLLQAGADINASLRFMVDERCCRLQLEVDTRL
ncbi:ankyrin repeat-containing domain protein [Trichophaea hybrida]|nr:ankyrin repeat-containing domain protein [Trichophaea hybrida]